MHQWCPLYRDFTASSSDINLCNSSTLNVDLTWTSNISLQGFLVVEEVDEEVIIEKDIPTEEDMPSTGEDIMNELKNGYSPYIFTEKTRHVLWNFVNILETRWSQRFADDCPYVS